MSKTDYLQYDEALDLQDRVAPESPGAAPTSQKRSSLQRVREIIRAPLAEFFGVAVFVLIGTASDCQTVLSLNPNVSSTSKGTFLSMGFGWATGLALGVWISAGISGGHVNPAITLALACSKKFPWKKVPVYILAQIAGGVVGAACTYGQYLQPINIHEGGHANRTLTTAGLFAPFPVRYLSPLALFTSEFVGTGILVFMIMATTDKHNAAPHLSLLPVAIFIIVLALGVAWGMETYSFNPARDLGSRLFLAMAGYGRVVFTYRRQYWLWGGFMSPALGAITAVGIYDLLLRREDPIQTVTKENDKADLNV